MGKKIQFFLEIPLNIEFSYLFCLCLGFTLLFYTNVCTPEGEQQFVYLAHAFLQGQLHFVNLLPTTATDLTFFNGGFFWPAGPLPAIILMPIVFIFGIAQQQGFITFPLHLLNFILLYSIAKKMTGREDTARWVSFGYIFSSAYLYIAIFPWSWFLSQTMTTTLLLLAIYEFLHKKRWLLIGTYLAGAVLTRANAFLAIVFFIGGLPYYQLQLKDRLKPFIFLCGPMIAALLLFFAYDYLRFGSIFERGDNFTHLANYEMTNNREFGLWSLVHFPANLYYLFLRSPNPVFYPDTKILAFPFLNPDTWGMSIFLTSPIFIWIFKTSWKEKLVKWASFATLLILFFDLGWFSIGFKQYGYRYALDFQPFLFIMLCLALKNGASKLFKIIVIASFAINLYLIFSMLTLNP